LINKQDEGFRSEDTLIQKGLGLVQVKISKRFRTIDNSLTLRDKLNKLTQQGKIKSYVPTFQSIATQISDMTQKKKMYFFIKGLKPSIGYEVRMRQPEPFERACALANEIEQAQALFQNRGESRARFTLSPTEKNQLRKQGACFNCGQCGHT
jgi:hypothetical protein